MPLINSFIKHVSCPAIFRRDGLKHFFPVLDGLEKSQYWTRDQLQDFQLGRLRKILVHAYTNTRFYRKRFDDVGFDPSAFKDFSEMERLPVLTKHQIRENLRYLVAKNYREDELHSAETGGSTGVKMRFFRDNACLSPKEAALYRFEKWAGWDFGERVGIVWTAQQDYVGHWTLKSKIKNALSLKQVVFPAAIMDQESIESYVRLLQARKPTMIRAFTSPICEVASFIRDKGIENISLRGVITTGEPLYEHQRKVISEAFHCEVFNSYRTREAGPIAQECEMHSGLHINAESLYLESLKPEHSKQFEAELGEIVVTDLLNYGMPLIRYKIGDVGTFSYDQCACGRGLPLLKNLAGRTVDMLYAPDRKRITAGSLVLYLLDEAPGLLGQVQIIQDKLDHLTIKMTADPPPTQEIMEYQKNTVRRLFGDQMKTSFEIVQEIPVEASGKYRFTINNIPETDL